MIALIPRARCFDVPASCIHVNWNHKKGVEHRRAGGQSYTNSLQMQVVSFRQTHSLLQPHPGILATYETSSAPNASLSPSPYRDFVSPVLLPPGLRTVHLQLTAR